MTPVMVSVIVPAYNSARTLPLVIRAMERQSYSAEYFEVIIIDDGSIDETPQLLRRIPLPTNFKVVRHDTNRGLAVARNTGIHKARGELLIFLDADMEANPDFIALHVQRQSFPNVVGVLSAILPAQPSRDKYQRYLYEARRGAKRWSSTQPLPYSVFVLGCSSVKRAALDTIGIFAAELTSYGGEDTELAYRLWRKYPEGLYYDPRIKVYHHHRRSLPAALNLLHQFGQTGVPLIVQKHPELAADYYFSYLPLSSNTHRWKRLVGALLTRPVILDLLEKHYQSIPYPFSNWWIKLAMFAALLSGLREALAARDRREG